MPQPIVAAVNGSAYIVTPAIGVFLYNHSAWLPWALVGLGAALAATRWVKNLLFGLEPHDPLTMGLAVLTLLIVAAIAIATNFASGLNEGMRTGSYELPIHEPQAANEPSRRWPLPSSTASSS